MNAMTYARKSRAHSGPSLKIGPQNDAFEQEADRKADEVMSLAGSTAQWSLSRMSVAPPVQRKCSCGGGAQECEECKAKGTVQRKASGAAEPSHAPAIVHDVIGSSGKPLDRATRSFFESRFGHDFSNVRIHSDARAAESARAVSAQAYTVGSNVVFGSGQYAPHSASGRKLLAHELAHVVQQGPASPLPQPANRQAEAPLKSGPTLHRKAIAHKPLTPLSRTTAGPRVQRSFLSGLLDVLLFIPRLFGLEYFPEEQLKDYLADLRKRRGPVGSLFSDNKARACVKREKELGPYDVDTKTWLIQDMLDGWTSPLDEGAIITLLRRSPTELQKIVTAVGRDHLWSKFGGKNRRVIEAMTMTATDAGEALVTRLRDLSPEELQDYSKNSSDPAVLEAVRRATALSKITAPVPASATIAQDNKAQITINRVEITFSPDGIDASLGNHAMTYGQFTFAENTPVPDTPENAQNTYDGTAPLAITLNIWTNFASEEAKSASSGYGAGSTLREHERTHGKGWIDFVTQNAPPQFPGRQNMSAGELNSAIAQYHAALEDYRTRAGDFALRAGDCSVPGRLPTDAQLAGTGLTAAICNKQPETAGQAPAAPSPAPAAPAPATPAPAPAVQPKLEVGTTTDPLEREADHVAEQAMRVPSSLSVSGKSRVEADSAPAIVHDVLQSGGEPLDRTTRSFFEPRFRRDFSSVRIYADSQAASSAKDVAAKAYTVGNKIVFNSGQYTPHTQEGRKLLAHELTHVVQQEGAARASHSSRLTVGAANHSSEIEADSAARVVGNGSGADGSGLKIASRQMPKTVQRLPEGWSSDYQNKWRNNPEAKSFLEKPYEEYKSGLGDVKATTQGGISENKGREYKGGAGKGTPAGAEITMPMLREMYPDFAKDVDDDTTGTRAKQAKAYLDNLNQAFRIMKIDTVEAQANYLAHAFIESGQFRAFTESQAGSGKPNNTWIDDPTKVQVVESALPKDDDVNVHGKFEFIGRGPVQVTHRGEYVESIAMLEKTAEQYERDAKAGDTKAVASAKTAREAAAAVKADPKQAANPKYAFLFSAALMKKRGSDVSVANQQRGTPWTGDDAASSWVAGGKQKKGTPQADALVEKSNAYSRIYDILLRETKKASAPAQKQASQGDSK